MNEFKIHFQELIEKKNWKEVKQELTNLDPFQIAEIIEDLSKSDQIILFRLLSRETAKETFQHLSHDEQEGIIEGMKVNINKLADLLNDLDPDDRTAFFEELPGEVSQRLMQLLSAEECAIATRLLGYPEDSIGRLMTTEFVAVKSYYTIEQALEHIRKFGRNSETLNVIYVVDEHWNLVDDVRIKEIILADPAQKISELTDNRFVALNAYDDQETAVKAFADNDRVALPVIGGDGTLLGIVTVDDVMDVAEEEHTEDFQKFGGVHELDLSYTKTSLLDLVKKRSPWLIILFFGEMLTTFAMGRFEGVIASVAQLAIFIPLIISSGGNSGSQAASLIIRSLALQELTIKNWFFVMRREFITGLSLGAMLGVIGFLRIFIGHYCGQNFTEYWYLIGISVSISLVFVVMWGTLSGSLIPLVLKRFKIDPATASAPFVATLVDVTGLIIYFTVAALFLTGRLL